MQQLTDAIRDDTVLVSIMAVNNEIGVKQPIAEIGALCRQRKVFFHTDAAQAVGKVRYDDDARMQCYQFLLSVDAGILCLLFLSTEDAEDTVLAGLWQLW